MKRIGIICSIVATGYLLNGCINLNHINNYSKTAVATIATYNGIGYTFTSSYTDYTLPSNLYNFNGDVAHNKLLLPTLVTAANEPETAVKADKAIIFYTTCISSYFDGLNQLSNKDLANYNFDAVSDDLKSDGGIKKFLNNTTDAQITAAANIAKVFTDGFGGFYRANKIKDIMIKYDGQVVASIETLKNILKITLMRNVDADKDLVDTKYKVALANPKIEMSAKLLLVANYRQEEQKLDVAKLQLADMVDALDKIEKEHQAIVIALKTNKIDSKAIIKLISMHSAAIYQLYVNMKSLNQKN